MNRWHAWAAPALLTTLALATAVWSVATSPRGSTPSATTTTTTTPPPDRVLTVSSTHLSVGEPVTITGSGCPPGHWGTPVLQSDESPAVLTPGSGGLYDSEEYFDTGPGTGPGATVGTDGAWVMTATVPMVPPGPATLSGWCEPTDGDGGVSIEFTYLPGLRVTVTTSYQLDVEQGTTVNAGTVLDINLLGGDCPGPSSPDIYLYDSGVQVVPAAPSTVDGWRYTVAVPAGLAPGQYRLEADCVYSRGAVDGSYAPVTITVR
jgi:hypothetical protein